MKYVLNRNDKNVLYLNVYELFYIFHEKGIRKSESLFRGTKEKIINICTK